jgi:hypothetical protein
VFLGLVLRKELNEKRGDGRRAMRRENKNANKRKNK